MIRSIRTKLATCHFSLTTLLVLSLVSLFPLPTSAQVQTGTPPFGSFAGGPETIDLANLNVQLVVPVLHKPGRGTDFNFSLVYNSLIWQKVTSNGSTSWQAINSPNWGWTASTVGFMRNSVTSQLNWCVLHSSSYTVYDYSWTYYDGFGTPHTFPGTSERAVGCQSWTTTLSSTATDGSGYSITANGSALTQLAAPNGSIINPATGVINLRDRNGNQISSDGAGNYYDTMSTTTPVLTTSTSGTPPTYTYSYTGPSGALATFSVKHLPYTVQTNFGCGIGEYGPISNNLVNEIDLPDWDQNTNPNSRYVFTYETTPGYSGSVTGRLASVKLPTGATITYSYSGGSNGINCTDGRTATLTRTTPDGTWIYANSVPTTTVTDPQNNQTVIQFVGFDVEEAQRQIYQGSASSGTLLETITRCYNAATPPCTTIPPSGPPITKQAITTQLGNSSGPQSKTVLFYNNYGMLTEKDDYDFPSASTLLKKTLITYAPLGGYLNAFTQTVTIQDGSGSVKFRQDTSYDQYSSFTGTNCLNSVPQHDDAGHGCSFTARGNATTITTYTSPGGTPSGGISKTLTYDSLGNLRTATDALNNTTTLAYSPDAWANTACNPATTSYAYPVSATNALNQVTSFKYYACSGQLASVKDPNNQTTSISYDSLLRPIEEDFPDTGVTTWTYNSPTSLTTTTKMNSSQNIVSTVLLDGLGRTSQTQLNSDPQNPDYSVITYDALGRAYQAYNPTRCSPPTTNCGESTWGYTTAAYDALGRTTSVTLQDGSVTSTLYTNNTITATDPAGKKRQSTFDGLGRLTQVTEDPGGLGYVTTYAYDALSNLVSVTQNGGRTRTFTYDALSRLVCESNPEIQIATCPNPDNGSYTAGTIRYTYDNGGNLTSRQEPAPNQTGSATVTTAYSWDLLHRLTQKSFSDGTTPTAAYLYDVSSTNGVTISNPIGRLVRTTTNNCIQTINSYDPMGRTTTQWLNTPSYCGPASFIPSYTYDLAGNMTSYSNGVGITFTQSFNTAGRPTGLTSSLVDAQHPATLATVDSTLGYYPHGGIHKATLGNGLTSTNVFYNTLQPCLIDVNNNGTVLQTCNDSTPSGNVLDLAYNYNQGSANNGNVVGWNATGNQSFVRTFGYDSLNRLSTLNQSSGNATGCSTTFNLSWTYDAWGNRTDQNLNSGTCGQFHATVNTKNQLYDPVNNIYQYDAAGNMTYDGNHHYFYDAENRLAQVDGTFGTCSAATACYSYDAVGRRVEKATGSTYVDYLYDLAGNVLTEWCTNCGGYTGPTTEYIFMSGNFVAEYKNNTTYFIHGDHLGSARLLTDLNQAVVQDLDYLPFGELNSSDSGITTHKFTGDERDSETGLDHTWFRQYSSSLGRWMHPDPAGLAAVDPTDPQSWNRYSYVQNSPLNMVDPLGLSDCPDMKATCGDDWTDPCMGSPGVDLFGVPGHGNPLCDNSDFWDAFGSQGSGVDSALPPCPDGVWAWAICIDKNGHIAGNYDGEIWCNGGTCSIWVQASHAWFPCVQGSYCLLPFYSYATGGRGGGGGDAAKQLGRAINATGVQALANPCTPAAFYALSVGGGLVTDVAAGGEALTVANEALAPHLPLAYRLLRNPLVSKAGMLVLKGAEKAGSAIQSGCNAMQK